jgi:predicted nuclease of predicted toxin-antitoxin system
VRRLVDANLSPRVVQALRDNGHDAAHVVDVGLATASDTEIAAHVEADGLIVVTADTDFPMHLALRRATSPSIVLLRRVTELSPDEHAQLLVANLPTVSDDLGAGRSSPSDRTPASSPPPARLTPSDGAAERAGASLRNAAANSNTSASVSWVPASRRRCGLSPSNPARCHAASQRYSVRFVTRNGRPSASRCTCAAISASS